MQKLTLFLCALLLAGALSAQSKVEQFTIDGKTYYGTKAIPKEICGLYKYAKTKEPIVEILENGTGRFQFHDVPAYPAEYWIETDAAGVIQKVTSKVNQNYQVVIIAKYGNNGQTGWKAEWTGKMNRFDVTMDLAGGQAIVLGERYRTL